MTVVESSEGHRHTWLDIASFQATHQAHYSCLDWLCRILLMLCTSQSLEVRFAAALKWSCSSSSTISGWHFLRNIGTKHLRRYTQREDRECWSKELLHCALWSSSLHRQWSTTRQSICTSVSGRPWVFSSQGLPVSQESSQSHRQALCLCRWLDTKSNHLSSV